MKKVSRFKILNIIFLGLLMLLNIYYLKPFIDKVYLDFDVLAFKKDSWPYSIVVFLIVSIIIVGYSYRIKTEKLKIWTTCLLILASFYLSYLLKNFTDNFLLYLNTKISHENVVTIYKVIENKENKVFELYDNKTFITSDNELKKINNQRIENKLKPIFDYKNNDTIRVNFNFGFLKVKYFK
jgi:hypothetical protein